MECRELKVAGCSKVLEEDLMGCADMTSQIHSKQL